MRPSLHPLAHVSKYTDAATIFYKYTVPKTVARKMADAADVVLGLSTLRASLSGTFLQRWKEGWRKPVLGVWGLSRPSYKTTPEDDAPTCAVVCFHTTAFQRHTARTQPVHHCCLQYLPSTRQASKQVSVLSVTPRSASTRRRSVSA